jgi:hypothetical protein
MEALQSMGNIIKGFSDSVAVPRDVLQITPVAWRSCAEEGVKATHRVGGGWQNGGLSTQFEANGKRWDCSEGRCG